ncbi:unnamed protein product [Rotaria sp. Silwood2]|nr:unnamed protein product [Rotaria sp. Silwood2]CAF3286811.1 unnamed protein product [Rotaria sp. Silwood2]CAF4109745.1 unnamed protein product [Rotaria sp. Silwood2]CAF4241814.1 unnamed protein product [Rotaria sp. Silwood2]
MLTVHLSELHNQLNQELKELFVQIHRVVANNISPVIQLKNDDVTRQALIYEIEKKLSESRGEIDQGVSKCLNKLYLELEKNPELTAIVRSSGKRRLYGDPYQAVVGQCRNGENSLLCSAEIYHNTSLRNIFKCLLKIGRTTYPSRHLVGNIFPIISGIIGFLLCKAECFSPREIGKEVRLERQRLTNQAETYAESNAETILKGLGEDICNHIRQTLCEQLNNINEDIRRIKARLIQQKDSSQVQHIAQFLKDNTLSIVQLYLNLLDKTNRVEYPHCEINLGTELGRSNFPVFAGELSDTDRTCSEKIAFERVPLNSFIW